MSNQKGRLAVRGEAAVDARGEAPRVVILGGGFGGLNAAKRLAGTDLEVVLVDRENHHLFQPLLYQVATAGLSPGDIATPIRSVFRGESNVRVLMAEAERVDREEREVELESGRLSYDYLIVATGARPKFFGPDAWREASTPLKSVEDALELRREILYAFERAEQSDDPEVVAEWLTFVIVGGGPTGVEMAGAIREIAAEVMVRDFRSIQPEEARVVLIDAAPRILRAYPEDLSEAAKVELEKREVEVWLEAPVEEITSRSVTARDETIPTRTVVWAAGVAPEPILETLETPLVDSGEAIVDETLALPGDERVYVVGDAAHFEHYGDEPLPGLAPVAVQQGKAAAENVRRRVRGEPGEPFEYWDRGQMATIGRKAAVAVVGETHLTGLVAWLAWLFVHLLFLIGFRNKLVVMTDWVYSYIAFKRGARLIVGEPENRRAEGTPPLLEEPKPVEFEPASTSSSEVRVDSP